MQYYFQQFRIDQLISYAMHNVDLHKFVFNILFINNPIRKKYQKNLIELKVNSVKDKG